MGNGSSRHQSPPDAIPTSHKPQIDHQTSIFRRLFLTPMRDAAGQMLGWALYSSSAPTQLDLVEGMLLYPAERTFDGPNN